MQSGWGRFIHSPHNTILPEGEAVSLNQKHSFHENDCIRQGNFDNVCVIITGTPGIVQIDISFKIGKYPALILCQLSITDTSNGFYNYSRKSKIYNVYITKFLCKCPAVLLD